MFAILLTTALAAPAFEADVVPKVRTEIQTACGTSPDIRVTWNNFGEDAEATKAFIGEGLRFLSNALTTVCRDATLKPEVAKQIKKIQLSQAYGAPDPIVYLVAGTLHVEYLWAKGGPAPDAAFVAAEVAARLRGEDAEAP